MNEKIDLKNYSQEMLTEYVVGLDMPAFRAKQLFSWLYRPGISDFDQMTDLSKDFRLILADKAVVSRLIPEVEEHSEDGTIKYGFRLSDGEIVEAVLIPEEERNTLCVSSQVGCAMGCAFCLTGKMGFKRNLTSSEIVNQITGVIDAMPDEMCASSDKNSGCINNLVFMGMGEPLANFDNLMIALDIIMDQRGLDFSGRRVTVSTCGLVPKMFELGKKAPVNLAVSLHSVKDDVRDALMPVNRKYPVDELLEACRTFPLPRRRMIMFEYIMIKDLNDSIEDAHELAAKLQDIRCKINLLPYNDCPDMPYERPSMETIEAFQNVLRKAGFSIFIRFSRGSDISAACGQLAGNHVKNKKPYLIS